MYLKGVNLKGNQLQRNIYNDFKLDKFCCSCPVNASPALTMPPVSSASLWPLPILATASTNVNATSGLELFFNLTCSTGLEVKLVTKIMSFFGFKFPRHHFQNVQSSVYKPGPGAPDNNIEGKPHISRVKLQFLA